jgi:hypothetical protein
MKCAIVLYWLVPAAAKSSITNSQVINTTLGIAAGFTRTLTSKTFFTKHRYFQPCVTSSICRQCSASFSSVSFGHCRKHNPGFVSSCRRNYFRQPQQFHSASPKGSLQKLQTSSELFTLPSSNPIFSPCNPLRHATSTPPRFNHLNLISIIGLTAFPVFACPKIWCGAGFMGRMPFLTPKNCV